MAKEEEEEEKGARKLITFDNATFSHERRHLGVKTESQRSYDS